MHFYICSVPKSRKENYWIGINNRTWGVQGNYAGRMRAVTVSDKLAFVVGGALKSIHSIESERFDDRKDLWPPSGEGNYQIRIKISDPIVQGAVPMADIADQISFMKGKAWGGTLQGASGAFNDRATRSDFEILEQALRNDAANEKD